MNKKILMLTLSTILAIAISLFYFNNIIRTEISNKATVNINPGPSESSSLDNSINNNEQRIYELYKKIVSNTASDETKGEFFNLTKEINWKNLNQVHESASYEILDWLYNNEISGEINITNLLKATKGLDGAMSEGYSAITAKLFLQDKRIFITFLSKLPPDNIDKICFYVAYGCSYYDIKQIAEDTEKMINTEKMTSEEIAAAKKLTSSLNNIFK